MQISAVVFYRNFVWYGSLLLLLTASFARGDSATEAQWLQLRELRGIYSGTSGSATTTYIFFDPNCPMSAKLNKSGLALPGVDMRNAMWIPVAYMQPSSSAKAVALLRAGKYEAILKNFQNFNYANYEGGVAGVTPTADDRLALERARVVWEFISKTPGTPVIVYKDKAGSVQVQLGVPTTASDGAKQTMGAYNE